MAATVTVPAADVTSGRRPGRWYRSPSLVTGLSIISVIVAASVAAPWLTQYDPSRENLNNILEGPSATHLLGTDDLGRDVWAQLLYGARIDLWTACLAVLFPFILGTILGLLAGYYGGVIDSLVTWATNVVFAFPFYVLIIALVFALGTGPKSIVIAITIVGWVSYARIIRGQVFVARTQEYVAAAKLGGFSDARILGRHILPNVITQAVVYSMSDIVLDILAIVALGYLGLGIQPPTSDWGRMIAHGQQFLTNDWKLATIPGLAVVLTGIGLALIADGLADVLRAE